MSNRDGLLDALANCRRVRAMHEAALAIAVDLLIEWHDQHPDPNELVRLRAETRTFLLNAPVGTRL